jgi:hypothetical protein
MQTFAGVMKTHKQGKTEVNQQGAADSQKNGYVEVNEHSPEKHAQRSNSVIRALRSFHNWCNNIKE